VASPYERARQTAELVVSAAGLANAVHLDERLRERELGILDLLTTGGSRLGTPSNAPSLPLASHSHSTSTATGGRTSRPERQSRPAPGPRHRHRMPATSRTASAIDINGSR
jgi:hypothetical protein